MSGNTYGRQVVLALTNKSGGGVIAGDVVIVDSSNDEAFTTTTTGAYTGIVGVAQETIANNAVGRVLMSGYAALVNVNASVTRGHYGTTHTVVKQATDAGASRVVGSFCQFLTGGTTPTAHLFAMPDASSATGNVATDAIFDAKADLPVGTGANTAQKLTVGTDGHVLTAASGETTGLKWSQPPGTLLAIVQNVTGGNKSTTSSTQADVDATNSVITFTAPASGNILVRVTCTINLDGASNQNSYLGLREATTDVVNKFFVLQCQNAHAVEQVCSWAAYLTGISAGSHTYKLAFAVNGGVSMTIRQAAGIPVIMEVWACA